jgi:hypothetical protein
MRAAAFVHELARQDCEARTVKQAAGRSCSWISRARRFIEPVIESPPEAAPRWRTRTTKVFQKSVISDSSNASKMTGCGYGSKSFPPTLHGDPLHPRVKVAILPRSISLAVSSSRMLRAALTSGSRSWPCIDCWYSARCSGGTGVRPSCSRAWQEHQTKGSSTQRYHRARGSAHHLVKHVLYLSSHRPAQMPGAFVQCAEQVGWHASSDERSAVVQHRASAG